MRSTAQFEIIAWDQEQWDESPAGTLGRARVTKQFHGEVEGSSVAEVLMAGNADGPLAYTAQERFTGMLGGREGTFLAQHGASADSDGPVHWLLLCGSGELAGIEGTAELVVGPDGSHDIVFEYELGEGS
jgi:hypothetical protein